MNPVNRLLFPAKHAETSYNLQGPKRVGDMEIIAGSLPFSQFDAHMFWAGRNPEVPCVLFPCDCARKVLVYAHGNCEDMWNSHQLFMLLRTSLNVHVLSFEYPGYGICPGKPTEASTTSNLEVVCDFLTDQLGFTQEDIILFGRSIGTGICIHYAATHQGLGALVLLSAFSSIHDVIDSFTAEHSGGWGSGVKFFIQDRFVSRDEIRNVRCQTLLMHGTEDDLIPMEQAQVLYELCGAQRKDLCLLAGMDHDNCLEDDNMQQMILRLSRALNLPDMDQVRPEMASRQVLDRIPRNLRTYLTVLYPQLDDAEYSGYLYKLGSGMDSWEERWFMLKDNFVWYFAGHWGSNVVGIVPLEGSTVQTGPESDEVGYSFQVNGPQNLLLLLAARDRHAFSEWTQALRRAAYIPVSLSPANLLAMAHIVKYKPELAGAGECYRYSIPCLLYPEKKGRLHKQQSHIPWSWRQRFFVLHGSALFYFKDQSSPEPQNALHLWQSEVEGFEKAGERAFQVRLTTGETMFFMAEDQTDKEDWMAAIQMASQRKGGDKPCDEAMRKYSKSKVDLEQEEQAAPAEQGLLKVDLVPATMETAELGPQERPKIKMARA
eukprot:TRINITY_DN11433_c0_g1_i2.p1 TRINITY_DN11433_c0_g1~~TRINITY_DN11433_c0_g1_i2.p1  ORF type:complete len:602 (+),score=132.50 TRINITY_DN11433_c0_g1_i2:142-1947(+)